jgi:hypothetical protein
MRMIHCSLQLHITKSLCVPGLCTVAAIARYVCEIVCFESPPEDIVLRRVDS